MMASQPSVNRWNKFITDVWCQFPERIGEPKFIQQVCVSVRDTELNAIQYDTDCIADSS